MPGGEEGRAPQVTIPGVSQRDMDNLGHAICASVEAGDIDAAKQRLIDAGDTAENADDLVSSAVAKYCPENEGKI